MVTVSQRAVYNLRETAVIESPPDSTVLAFSLTFSAKIAAFSCPLISFVFSEQHTLSAELLLLSDRGISFLGLTALAQKRPNKHYKSLNWHVNKMDLARLIAICHPAPQTDWQLVSETFDGRDKFSAHFNWRGMRLGGAPLIITVPDNACD